MRGCFIAVMLSLALLAGCGSDEPRGTGGTGGGSTSAQSGASTGIGGSPAEPVPGLYAEYFAAYLDLALARVEPSLDASWADGGPDAAVGSDRFSARWTGFVSAPETGSYQLIAETDDGVRVWVDDALVIDDWHGHFVTRNEATIELEADRPTPIRVDYFEIDLDASARLSWTGPGIAEEVVPTEHLTTLATPGDPGGPKPPYQNPVIPFDCPDPGVLATEGDAGPAYYAVCTGGAFPIRSSRSLVSWQDTGTALLPDGKPSWANNGFRNWAPEIHRVGGEYVAYFTTVNAFDVLSIGAAHASDVLGPYVDIGVPLVEHPDGVIDATFFEDGDGSRWLLYKIDGNAKGAPTPIFIRQLAGDGLSFLPESSPVQVLVNDPATWEGGVVEAPWLFARGGFYYLFYSGNVYDHRYRTGVARSSALLGPYQKLGPPILANNERWVGPGHGSIAAAGAFDYFVYHAWTNAGDGTQLASEGRQVLVDRIDWQDGWPRIHNGTPSRSPQPWPGEP